MREILLFYVLLSNRYLFIYTKYTIYISMFGDNAKSNFNAMFFNLWFAEEPVSNMKCLMSVFLNPFFLNQFVEILKDAWKTLVFREPWLNNSALQEKFLYKTQVSRTKHNGDCKVIIVLQDTYL